MHIKYVTVQGFKSYRDAVKTDALDPGHNIVVGRNGSGKSNFFNAIQFVLSEDYSRLSVEQRQSLIYEGVGATRVMSAYVEIIFDNSDRRLLIEKEEVALRRHIGAKKDQFFLDGKIVTRNEVMNLLESAGFSRSNPYYIVRQGKINEIATAKDEQRLKLLKEVAGTKVYDDRKKEAEQLMHESDTKLVNANELLQLIDDKLKTLEQEKAELVEYQKLDKRKRALEFSISNTELREVKRKLDELSKKRSDEISSTAQIRQTRYEAENHVQKIKTELSEHLRRTQQLVEEQNTCDRERTSIVQKKERLDLRVRDYRKQQQQDTVSHDSMREELEKLQEEIQREERKLEEIIPRYEKIQEEECEAVQNLNQKKFFRDELSAQRGRKDAFSSREARDQYLEKQIQSINNERQIKVEERNHCKTESGRSDQIIQEIETKIDQIAHEKQQHQTAWEQTHSELTELKKGREQLFQLKHELVRKENSAYSQIQSHQAQMQSRQHKFQVMLGKTTHNAIKSLNRVKETFRSQGRQDLVDGFYGQVIDHIRCPEPFFTCFEAAAGGKLFNFVMKNVNVVKAYVKEMNKQNLPGSPNFLPLENTRVEELKYPELFDENNASVAFPLWERIEVEDERFTKIVKWMVGRYMVTVDSKWSTKISREYTLSCVTLDGDMNSHRGVIQGGHRDPGRSKLKAHHEIHNLDNEQLKDLEEDYSRLRKEKNKLEEQSQKLLDDISNKEASVQKHRQLINKSGKEEAIKQKDRKNRLASAKINIQTIKSLEVDISHLDIQLKTIQKELASDWSAHSGSLSQEQTNELELLTNEVSKLEEKVQRLRKERGQQERIKNKMESHLHDNLEKRREKLINDTDDISFAERQQQLATCEADLETATREFEYVEKRLYELSKEIDQARDEEATLKTNLDDWQSKEKDCGNKLDEEQKSLVKLSSKQQTYTQKRDEAQRQINEIGPVAQEIVRKFTGISTKNLYSRLHDTKTQLQKYSNVNKKALDQFVSSSDERKNLEERKKEIIKGKQAIEEMMEVLEEKKYNQILFTFQQVSDNFKRIFSKLVAGGTANLIMKKKEVSGDGDGEPPFSGVSIKVSFSGGAETREMNQLSGGQKSLVALTLIFAIQKCDPAPFYLFDEIDAALDPAYRKQVASMIRELTEKAQFISTTFRPELLEAGDKFLGVLYKGKISDVRTITKTQAQEFVDDDAVHG